MNERDLIATAVGLQKTGRLEEAKALYERILQEHPKNADAHHLLGVIAVEEGELDLAQAHIECALSIQPHVPMCLTNLALVHEKKGNLSLSISLLKQALSHSPEFVPALQNLGACLMHLPDFEAAQSVYSKLLAIDPSNSAALLQDANCALSLGAHDDAVRKYETFLATHPAHIAALSNLGLAWHRMKQYEHALAYQDRALAIHPNHLPALILKGSHLSQLGRHQEALEALRVVESLAPDFPNLEYNLGTVLVSLDHLEEAQSYLERAHLKDPSSVEVLYNLGICLFEQGKMVQAVQRSDQALQLNPLASEVHWNRALSLLLMGQLQEGMAAYEWRWKRASQKPHRTYLAPRWDGRASVMNKRVIIHCEQGFGDSIQSIRFVENLKALGAITLVEGPPALQRLFNRLEFVDDYLLAGATVGETDFHIPMMSLQHALGLYHPIQLSPQQYLHADAALCSAWAERLSSLPRGLKVGVSWSGSRDHPRDRHRSIKLEAFLSCLQVNGVSCVAIQKDLRPEDQDAFDRAGLIDFRSHLTDFSETAALLSCLDLVITVDTSVAHLAGALGKKTFLLLGKVPDWRWLLEGDRTHWYSSVTLFRQTERLIWHEPLAAVAQALNRLTSD